MASILLLLIPPAIGVCAGFAAGGRLGRLASLRFRAGWLLLIAALIQVVQYYSRPVRILFTRDLGVPMLAIVFALVAAWLVVNFLGWSAPLRLAGAAISLGAVLNEAARTQKPLSFFTTGQRIPEDLEAATHQRLLRVILGDCSEAALQAA